MSLRRILLPVMVLLSFQQSQAQFHRSGLASHLDSIRISFKDKPVFFLNLAGFNSFISGDLVGFYGFRTGVTYHERIRLGMGFFLMNPNDVTSSIIVHEDTVQFSTVGELQVRYLSLSGEYVFYRRQPWQFSIYPVDIGFGGAHYRYISQRGSHPRLETPDEPLLFYQPSVTAQYSLFSWVGLSAYLSYRTTLYSSQRVREDWSAIGFSAGVKVFLDEAYREIFPDGLPLRGNRNSRDGGD